MPLKLIFMGTPDFAVPILKSINNSEHKILSVYTKPPKQRDRGQKINLSPVNLYSNEIGLNVRYPKTLNNESEFHFIKSLSPDVVVVVAYGKLLPAKILNIGKIKFLNIHASLLPRWRGAAPIQRSIMEMDRETGVSIMQITPELDAGPYMLQEKINIEKNDNYLSLSDKLSTLGSKAILKSLNMIENNNYNFIKQEAAKVTYAKKIDKQESEINWNETSKRIIAKINGLNPFPGVWFKHKGVRLKIIKAVEVNENGDRGQILDNNLTIGCKENAIRILSIQKEGKKILSADEFLAGYKIVKGEILT